MINYEVKSFVVDSIEIAKVMEILLDRPMMVYKDDDKVRYAFPKTSFIGRAYAQACNIVKLYNNK